MSSTMKITNESKLSIVLDYWQNDVSKQQSIQVNPHETVTIINTWGNCEISLFFKTDAAEYDDNRKAWDNFWIDHDMPVDIYSIGILSNTLFFPGFLDEKYVVFESLYIEELMKITRDSDR